jgi:hypothetical protein
VVGAWKNSSILNPDEQIDFHGICGAFLKRRYGRAGTYDFWVLNFERGMFVSFVMDLKFINHKEHKGNPHLASW